MTPGAMKILRAADERICGETAWHIADSVLACQRRGSKHAWVLVGLGHMLNVIISRETARIILRGLLDRRTTEYLKMRDTDVEILEGHRDALIKENLELLEEIDTLKREREEVKP